MLEQAPGACFFVAGSAVISTDRRPKPSRRDPVSHALILQIWDDRSDWKDQFPLSPLIRLRSCGMIRMQGTQGGIGGREPRFPYRKPLRHNMVTGESTQRQ